MWSPWVGVRGEWGRFANRLELSLSKMMEMFSSNGGTTNLMDKIQVSGALVELKKIQD